MNEFSLINKYCREIGVNHQETTYAVGDDAAVIDVPEGQELVVSVDTMVEDVHFFAGTTASHIAHKLFAVNLSDMAAMGAQPKWATIALTLPETDEAWIKEFTYRANELATQYGVQLIGGDMTRGKLTLSMQIMGLVSKGKAIYRSNAKAGDDVYVSNTIGDAALYLQTRKSQLEAALNTPVPRVELGSMLSGLINSCIDVSDGLLADLSHIAKSSDVTMMLDVSTIPLSKHYQNYIAEKEGNIDLALTGGDDYELAFTAPVAERDNIVKCAESIGEKVTIIGSVHKSLNKQDPNASELISLNYDGAPYDIREQYGYRHF